MNNTSFIFLRINLPNRLYLLENFENNDVAWIHKHKLMVNQIEATVLIYRNDCIKYIILIFKDEIYNIN